MCSDLITWVSSMLRCHGPPSRVCCPGEEAAKAWRARALLSYQEKLRAESTLRAQSSRAESRYALKTMMKVRLSARQVRVSSRCRRRPEVTETCLCGRQLEEEERERIKALKEREREKISAALRAWRPEPEHGADTQPKSPAARRGTCLWGRPFLTVRPYLTVTETHV